MSTECKVVVHTKSAAKIVGDWHKVNDGEERALGKLFESVSDLKHLKIVTTNKIVYIQPDDISHIVVTKRKCGKLFNK